MKHGLAKNLTTILRGAGSLLSLGLLLFLISGQGWAELFAAMRQMPAGAFWAGVAFLLISRLFVVARWHVLLRGAGMNVTYWEATVMTFTGLFASNFLPSTIGGDVVRLVGIVRLGYDRAICLASLAADRLVGMAGFAFTLPFGLIPWLQSGVMVLPGGMIMGAWFQRGRHFAMRTAQAFSLWLRQPGILVRAIFITWGNMLFLFLCIYSFTYGLGAEMSFWMVAGAWTLTYYVTLVPVSINGLGLQELSATYFFTTLGGLTLPQALALAVLIRFAFVFASLPGAFFLPGALAAASRLEQKP